MGRALRALPRHAAPVRFRAAVAAALAPPPARRVGLSTWLASAALRARHGDDHAAVDRARAAPHGVAGSAAAPHPRGDQRALADHLVGRVAPRRGAHRASARHGRERRLAQLGVHRRRPHPARQRPADLPRRAARHGARLPGRGRPHRDLPDLAAARARPARARPRADRPLASARAQGQRLHDDHVEAAGHCCVS